MKNTQQGLLRPAFIRDSIPQHNLIPKSNSYLMKYILLFIILIISFSNVYGQSITWQRTYDYPEDRGAYACLELFNGNYMITSDAFQYPSIGMPIIIIDKWGNIIESRSYYVPRMRSILQLQDSSIIMAGGDGIFKISKSLDSSWFISYGWHHYNKIISLPNNNFLACGYYAPGFSRGFIAKFNEFGDTLWTLMIDSSIIQKDIMFKDIAYIDENNIFIAGTYSGGGLAGDAILCKLNTYGIIQYLKRFTTPQWESLYSIMYIENNLYMTGFKWDYQSFLLKSDLNGNQIYLKYFPEITLMGVKNNSGYIIMCGWNDTLFHPAARMVDLNGIEIWYRTVNNSHYELNPQDVKLTHDNGILMTAYQYDSVYDKNTIYLLRTDSNFIIEPIGIKFNNEIIEDFKLEQNYPNPFNPTTTIKYHIPKDGIIEFKVYDIQGREIFYYNGYKQQREYEYEFDGSKLSSGVYFYQLTLRLRSGNEMTLTKKMLLIK